jgi:hypothetical protein
VKRIRPAGLSELPRIRPNPTRHRIVETFESQTQDLADIARYVIQRTWNPCVLILQAPCDMVSNICQALLADVELGGGRRGWTDPAGSASSSAEPDMVEWLLTTST